MSVRTTAALFALPAFLAVLSPSPEPATRIELHGFEVQLVNDFAHHELHDAVFAELGDQLFRITRVVAEPALAKLRAIPIRVGFEDRRHARHCMFYHPSKQWLADHEYPTELAGGVEIANARNFLSWTLDQPWMVLHELAHGYHHQVLGYGHAGIRAAYGAAKQAGTYDEVLRIGGRKEKHYALENDQEYFAEATEAYFGTNDFYPFVRAELAAHDERGYHLLEQIWGPRRR
ncbi:MAG: hypothetical protein KDE27_02560 [Planctomycetes bacterium]|nr:hypothetical protein [Planctomycetota bacterium]